MRPNDNPSNFTNDMKKVDYQIGALLRRQAEISDRLNEMADTLEREKRCLTADEEQERSALTSELQGLELRMYAHAQAYNRENPDAAAEAVRLIRENARAGRKSEIVFVRAMMMVSDAQTGGAIPLNIQDIVRPLTEGFILDKVGLPMLTGLAGDYVWPAYENVEASIAGEGVALSDTKISMSKLQAKPERIGVAIPVTNQALNQTEGVLETIVREILPKAVQLLLNKIVFSVNKVTGATSLVGPFVALKTGATVLSAVPTSVELNKLKAKVLESGVEGSALCWVMTKAQAAVLEVTPVNDKGVYVPMIQDGKLLGLPVYTTNAIRDTTTEYIGLGDWRYQPMGLFGQIRFTVDPYSQARKDAVDFVLNCDYGTATLQPKAFALGKVNAGG